MTPRPREGDPTFLVWCPEHDVPREDAEELRNHDAESAAQEWAESYDSNSTNYPIAGRITPTVVHVLDAAGVETRWMVRGEFSPSYYAWEAEAETSPEVGS